MIEALSNPVIDGELITQAKLDIIVQKINELVEFANQGSYDPMTDPTSDRSLQIFATYENPTWVDTNDVAHSNTAFPTDKTTIKKVYGLGTSITTFSELFYGASNLVEVYGKYFPTSGKTTMYRMFAGCSSLTTLVGLENWDTSSVTSMRLMFQGCGLITSANFSFMNDWDVSHVTSFTDFSSGVYTIKCNLRNWNCSSVTSGSTIFRQLSQASTLIQGDEDNIDTDTSIKIMEGWSISVEFANNIHRPSIVAFFRGLAVATNNQTITLSNPLKTELTAADKAIATDKGWTIV